MRVNNGGHGCRSFQLEFLRRDNKSVFNGVPDVVASRKGKEGPSRTSGVFSFIKKYCFLSVF